MLPQISRFGFPENVDPNAFTLITPFRSERDKWIHSKCVNIHDCKSPIYELSDEYGLRKVMPKNFFVLLDSYQDHPEAKSLGPKGNPCEFDTRGVLQRAHVVAKSPPIYIGKESDRHWEEGEDLSLLVSKAVQYKRRGSVVADDEQLERIRNVSKREFMRRGINQHTLEKICNRKPVRAAKLMACLKALEDYEREKSNSDEEDLRCLTKI